MATLVPDRFVYGARRLQVRIATIRAALVLPALSQELGKLLVRRTLERFDREVDPGERPWKALKTDTLKRRSGSGSTKILNRTGALRGAIRLIRGGQDSIYTNTGAGVRIGVDDPRQLTKARTHQRGYPKGNIPARRFLGIGKNDVKSVDSFLRRRADVAGE